MALWRTLEDSQRFGDLIHCLHVGDRPRMNIESDNSFSNSFCMLSSAPIEVKAATVYVSERALEHISLTTSQGQVPPVSGQVDEQDMVESKWCSSMC